MTEREREHTAGLEATVLDRERRLLNLASIIRRLVRNGAVIPLDMTIDYTITREEAAALGVTDYDAAILFRTTPG